MTSVRLVCTVEVVDILPGHRRPKTNRSTNSHRHAAWEPPPPDYVSKRSTHRGAVGLSWELRCPGGLGMMGLVGYGGPHVCSRDISRLVATWRAGDSCISTAAGARHAL